ncbi:hypothetical protein H8356DRAFT_1435572 [Neocallimastix lanati (nom. inval.)]|nr:hypothetical protein H8356DRAFT_1435572 [Neocallimastix sp. JGI-2020a]
METLDYANENNIILTINEEDFKDTSKIEYEILHMGLKSRYRRNSRPERVTQEIPSKWGKLEVGNWRSTLKQKKRIRKFSAIICMSDSPMQNFSPDVTTLINSHILRGD